MKKELTHHDIYDACLDEEVFTSLPSQLARDLNLPSVLFFWVHPGDLSEISAGTQPETHTYYDDVQDHDLWMASVSDDHLNKGAFRLSDHVTAQQFQNSLMYNEFIVKNRLERFWCAGILQNTRDGRVATAFHKGQKSDDFSDMEMKYINGHSRDLGRMHRIRRELQRNSIQEIAAADNTLRDEVPLFELDHEGKLLRMNGKAEWLLQLHPNLVLLRSRVLALSGSGALGFRAAVSQATSASLSTANAFDLPQTRGTDGRILPPFTLSFLPQNNGGRRVLVIATTDDPDQLLESIERPEETVRLTPRERDILNGLVRGLRRDQLAHELGVAIPSVDLHSRNLRCKLGAQTTAQAVAIAFKTGVL